MSRKKRNSNVDDYVHQPARKALYSRANTASWSYGWCRKSLATPLNSSCYLCPTF